MSQPEATLQKHCADYMRVCCPEVLVVHCPNGSIMGGVLRGLIGEQKANTILARFMNFLKSMGLCPGFPDWQLFWQGGNNVLVEFKSDRGRLTPDQESLHTRLIGMGFTVFVVRSLEQLKDIILKQKIPCRDHYNQVQA